MTARHLVIADYSADWPDKFKSEAEQLARILGPLADRIEHVGSTAVPGLAAKPIMDIQVSSARVEPRRRFDELLAIRGYVHVPFGPRDRRYPFFQRPALWPTAFHLHLCVTGSTEELDHLAFRDYLRGHPETALEYAHIKRRLAKQTGTTLEQRSRYSAAKTPFIATVLRRARGEPEPERRTPK